MTKKNVVPCPIQTLAKQVFDLEQKIFAATAQLPAGSGVPGVAAQIERWHAEYDALNAKMHKLRGGI